MKLSQSCLLSTTSTISQSVCNSYTLNGQTYTNSGTYTHTLLNSTACDSTITINLTISGSNTTGIISACNSFSWQGNTFTSSGAYQVTYPSTSGCDSILNLILTIKQSVSTTINTSICEGQSYLGYTTSGTYTDTYVAFNGCDSIRAINLIVKPRSFSTLNMVICEGQSFNGHTTSGFYTNTFIAAKGCDSIQTLNLTVNPRKYTNFNVSICEGQNQLAGGQLQVNSGIFKDTLHNFQGCDSIITTNLIVNPKPRPNLGLDKDMCFGKSVTFNPGSFLTYQWQDLTTFLTFTTNNVGSYWVIVKNNFNCTASDTIRINTIHPLPSNFLKKIDSVCEYEKLKLKSISNYQSYAWSNNSLQDSITVTSPGLYWLSVKDINGCVGIDTINVKSKSCIKQVFIPSAFTPNKDGNNDIFRASVFVKLFSSTLKLFDRYGNLIFRTNDFSKGWDGTYKRSPFNSGTFVWQCYYQLEGKKNEYQKGVSILIR